MHEMTLKSLSLFVGSSRCNGNCKHCAGIVHRKYSPLEDGEVDLKLIEKTIRNCYLQGARSLSISSSGEPTLSPISLTKVFELLKKLNGKGIIFDQINLYSNGIRLGEDEDFCLKYLPLWKDCGLKTIYITVHNTNEEKNAKIYGIKKYPSLSLILSRIHEAGLFVRSNIVLSKNNIGTFIDFKNLVLELEKLGFDKISAWSIKDENDKLDKVLAPESSELTLIEKWVFDEEKNYITIHREQDQLLYKENKKLTLFPDGTLSNTWCNR